MISAAVSLVISAAASLPAAAKPRAPGYDTIVAGSLDQVEQAVAIVRGARQSLYRLLAEQ